MAIPHESLLADAQQVLVGPEIVEGHDRRVLLHDRRGRHCLERLLEPGRVRLDARARARDAHDDVRRDLARAQPAAARGHRVRHPYRAARARAARRRGDRTRCREATLARARLEPLELLGDVERTIVAEASRPQDEVGPIEIHAEPTPSSCEAVGYPAPEILEEVLQLVALGQTLDQLDLPDRDAGLARDRHREIAFLLGERRARRRRGPRETRAARPPRAAARAATDGPSPAPNRAAARVAPASRRSPRRPSGTEGHERGRIARLWRSGAQPQPPLGLLEQVQLDDRRVQQARRAAHDGGQQHVERLGARRSSPRAARATRGRRTRPDISS